MNDSPNASDNNNFDTTYTIDNASNKYALLPTLDQTVYQTDKAISENPAPIPDFKAYYGAKLTLATIAGEYKTTITYTAVGAEVPEPPEIACVTGEQFKGDVGDIKDAAIATSAWSIGDTGIATDNRGDGQEYCIGKLADDNVWMLNNLKLGSFDDSIGLTPVDTNITDDWSLPEIDNTTEPGYGIPRLRAFIDGQSNFATTKPNSEETDINSPNFAGYYYNWCAATAGLATTTCTSNSIMPPDAAQDICPANWRMPTGGSSGEFAILNGSMYKGTLSPADTSTNSVHATNFRFDGPFRGAFTGGYSASLNIIEGYGLIWSASHSILYTSALGLIFNDDLVRLDHTSARSNSLSVRCLLR
jgi:hypothetical protein